MLFGRVFLDYPGEFEGERVRVRCEPLMVVWAEVDHEVVGHHRATAADDRCSIVAFPLERAGDLDGLYLRLERTREGAADESLQTALEPVENSHGHLLIAHRSDRYTRRAARHLLLTPYLCQRVPFLRCCMHAPRPRG